MALPVKILRQRLLANSQRTALAWRTLIHDQVRFIVSTLAVSFAVLIMFMEMGFLNGLYDSQTGALRIFDADLMMVSSGLHIFNTHDTFPRARLEQVAGFRGVRSVASIYIEDRRSTLRNPATGIEYVIRAIAFDVAHDTLASPTLARAAAGLHQPLSILFDEQSRPFFGTFSRGITTELGKRAVTVAGTFRLGPDYYYDGNVLLSSDTFFAIFPHQTPENVVLGLVKVDRGVSPEGVLRDIRGTVGSDVEIMTKSDLIAREKAKWRKATPAGYVFTMGVVVGFVIGVFICYQILFTHIADHITQFATLKAIGYDNGYVVRLVLTQAVMLGITGFIPAVIATFGLYSVLTGLTGIITQLTMSRALMVFCLTIGMCLVAGRIAVRKALAADPAELF